MFKIEAIQDITRQAEFAQACGTVARDGTFAYAMFDVETLAPMGFAQFDISDGCGRITDLREAVGRNDFEAMFILGRSTMNFIDLSGAHIAYAEKDAGEESLLKAIGFMRQDDESYYCDMTGFFTGGCGNH